MSGSRNPDEDDRLPAASTEVLRRRADILWGVRRFFRERGALEVETPVLCHAGTVDEHLDPIPAFVRLGESTPASLWLVTSPEHSMKRLLASGLGPIFQITRAFRDGERGRLHNPEFSILEWYRPGFDHHALMTEVEDLVRAVLGAEGAPEDLAAEASLPFERLTYRDAFLRAARLDPFEASDDEIAASARERAGLDPGASATPGGGEAKGHPVGERDRDSLLQVLLVSVVERTLGFGRPTFLLDYPPSQAALARIRPDDPPVAERFELYVRGIEIANGYHELTEPNEQERRFAEAAAGRRAAGKAELPVDRRLLEALRAGLPECAGVALGLDRLVLLAVGAERIDDVLAFPIERA